MFLFKKTIFHEVKMVFICQLSYFNIIQINLFKNILVNTVCSILCYVV